jgi:hypothetical protein
MNRYTAYARFEHGDIEEIDVDAASEEEARSKAQTELERDYLPGGQIVRVVERVGLYF